MIESDHEHSFNVNHANDDDLGMYMKSDLFTVKLEPRDIKQHARHLHEKNVTEHSWRTQELLKVTNLNTNDQNLSKIGRISEIGPPVKENMLLLGACVLLHKLFHMKFHWLLFF